MLASPQESGNHGSHMDGQEETVAGPGLLGLDLMS